MAMSKIKFDLKVVRSSTDDARQAAIQNVAPNLNADFDRYYVDFSGYFGDLGANLFAAAPDLLDALKAALPVITGLTDRLDGTEASPLHRQIVAAIDKAEGK
jgi:hypothetical protein